MWKDEDVATPELMREYLAEFRQGIESNTEVELDQCEKSKVEESLKATEKFCIGLLTGRKSVLYMHDLILMAIGFYGGHLTAMDRRQG